MPSQLSLKPDWTEAQQRLAAWWKRDTLDRVCLGVIAPKAGPVTRPPLPSAAGMPLEEYYLNAELRIAQAEYHLAGQAFLGEAFPNVSLNLGPGSMALYLGSPPGYHPDTVWFHRWPPAAEGALPEYDEHNPIWVQHQAMHVQLAEAARGRYLPNIPDVVEAMDILASLRGNQELLCDLIDRPDWVHACQERLVDLYFQYYDRFYEICKADDNSVSFTAFHVWAPGRMAKLQTDFSAMISPAMFAEFQLPYLRRVCQGLDCCVYHLDGCDAIVHLDQLLSIPELNAIQWGAGAGKSDVWDEEWYPIYRKVRDAGKGLLLLGGYNPDAMARLVRTFGPTGLNLHTWAPTQQAGEELLTHAEKHWAG